MAWVHLSAWDPGRAFDAVRRGLAELDRPLPRSRFVLLVSTLFSFLVGLGIGATKLGFGSASAERRARYELQATFYDIGGYASTLQMNVRMRAIMAFRSLYLINRLGPGTEYSRQMAGFGLVANLLGKHKLAKKLFAKAADVAADLGDPVIIAHVEWKRGVGTVSSAAPTTARPGCRRSPSTSGGWSSATTSPAWPASAPR